MRMAPNAPRALVRRMFALFREGGVEQRPDRLAGSSYVTWRPIASTDDLAEVDIRAIVAALEYWLILGELTYRCRRIAEKMQEVPA